MCRKDHSWPQRKNPLPRLIFTNPARRVIGDLSEMHIIFNYLGLPFGSQGDGR